MKLALIVLKGNEHWDCSLSRKECCYGHILVQEHQ